MVARLCRLRLTLLFATFRGSGTRVLRDLAVGLLAIGAAIALAWAPTAVADNGVGREAIDTMLFALVTLTAATIPFFYNTRHLEPRQFGSVPARKSQIGAALLISTLFSWPVIWLGIWLTALVVLRPEWREAGWWMVVAGIMTVMLVVLSARVASALSKLAIPPRSHGVLRATGALLIVSLLPITVFAVAETLRSPGGVETSEVAATIAFTPFASPIVAVLYAAEGETNQMMWHLGIVVAYLIALTLIWSVLVKFSLERIEQPADPLLARRSMGWFDRFSAKPAAVIGARSLTYWVRDPRYRVALAAAPIGAVFAVAALWIAGLDPQLIALIPLPLIMLLLGWSLHNDIATDSTAIWMHIASGTRGYQDRLGRLVPVLMFGFVLILVGSSLTVTVMGEWRALPSVIGLNTAVLLVACGVASVWSAMRPYPTTRPGDSPFAQPAVSGSGGGTAQTFSMIVILVLVAPPVWVAVDSALNPSLGSELFSLGFGAAYGAAVLALGVLFGGLIFDRAGPEYVALTQTFD